MGAYLFYGSEWESNPPWPARRDPPPVLKTGASTGTHPPPYRRAIIEQPLRYGQHLLYREASLEVEGVGCGAVFGVVVNPFDCLGNGRPVPRYDVPQHRRGLLPFGEPLAAAREEVGVVGFVGVLIQRVDTFPHRHIHDDERVIAHADAGGVVAIANKPPHETGRIRGQCVDLDKGIGEIRDAGVIEWGDEAGGIELRNVIQVWLLLM